MKRGLFLLLLFVASFGSIAAISLQHKNGTASPHLSAITSAVKKATSAPVRSLPPEDYTLGFTLLRF